MLDVAQAAALLRAGELVAIPTETVYGLGADALNVHAVARIFAAKGRPADHPLIVHLPAAECMHHWARDIPEFAWQLAEAFWPGPLTLILKRQPDVPDVVTGGQDTVGLRVPGHPLALALLREFNGGVAAPSANKFGRISPTTAAHVRDEFGDTLAILDGGPCTVGIESTIIDLSCGAPLILRPGQLGPDAIAAVTGHIPGLPGAQRDIPRVSGSLEAHYAPRTPLRLVAPARLAAEVHEAHNAGRAVAVLAMQPVGSTPCATWLQAPADAAGYAHDLYANLRRLDGQGGDLILAELPPESPAWDAIADRLRRATAGSGGI